ncbi:uncharacterized protein LOC101751230 [Gallus gallus]|uniref:uncharacterized protein LOC101751230 n=1 Tax=Gallus gallus TaxID=9031 RepID=UPI001F0276AC|nr:uncharacterized protein LOC101751230 [Gallus gallus]
MRPLACSLTRSLPHRRLTALTTASRQSRAGRSGSSAPREEAVGVVRLRRGRNYSSQHASRREGGSAAGGQPSALFILTFGLQKENRVFFNIKVRITFERKFLHRLIAHFLQHGYLFCSSSVTSVGLLPTSKSIFQELLD